MDAVGSTHRVYVLLNRSYSAWKPSPFYCANIVSFRMLMMMMNPHFRLDVHLKENQPSIAVKETSNKLQPSISRRQGQPADKSHAFPRKPITIRYCRFVYYFKFGVSHRHPFVRSSRHSVKLITGFAFLLINHRFVCLTEPGILNTNWDSTLVLPCDFKKSHQLRLSSSGFLP